jgi:hypothetical protein
MATGTCIMTFCYFIVDLLIGRFPRGFFAKNFACIPYFPHYEYVTRCESFESTEFIPRIRLMFKVFSVALHCC